MRDFRLIVPEDCTASNMVAENDHALAQMRQILRADTTPSTRLDLGRLLHGAPLHRPAPAEQGDAVVAAAQGEYAGQG